MVIHKINFCHFIHFFVYICFIDLLARVCVCVTSSGLALFEKNSVFKPSASIIQQKEKLQKELEELLGTDGVFLYPSHPRVAPKHHHPLFRPFDFAYTG